MRFLVWLAPLFLYALLVGVLVYCISDRNTLVAGLVSLSSFVPNTILTHLLAAEKKRSESAAKDIVFRAKIDIGGESVSKDAIRAWLVANQEWSEKTRELVNKYLTREKIR